MVNNMIYYVELNIIALIMCIIIQVKESSDKQEIFTSKSFRHILFIIELIVVLDTLSLLVQNDRIPHNHWFHLMVMNGYFILQALFPLELFRYCTTIDSARTPDFKGKIYIPFICNVITIAVNSFHPFAYHIIENDLYERMSPQGFFFINAWPLIYIVAGIYVVFTNIRKSTEQKRENYRHIVVFGLIALICSVLAFMFKGFLLWPFIAIDLIYLYLNVLSKTNKKLDILAFKDSLTGIGNVASYNSFTEHIKEQINAGTAKFAIVVMDANGLKFINDNYGHEAGNILIKSCSKFICEIFRHSPVFRIGGDEFAAILENSDYNNREKLLQTFDETIKKQYIEFDDKKLRVSIARGIGVFSEGMNFPDVFYAADSEMYINKEKVKKEENIPSR